MTADRDDALLNAWRETLAAHSQRPAVIGINGTTLRTFGGIDVESNRLSDAQLRGCPAGSVIAIQTGNHESWPALLLACLRMQLIVLPLESSSDAALRVCDASAVAQLSGDQVVLRTLERSRATPIGDGISLLKITSGTTGTPRAIRFRSEQLLADCENICETMGITARDVNFGAIPVSHSYGFSNLITPLIVRGVPLVLSADRMPRAIVDGICRSGATVFPGMPVFFQTMSEVSDVAQLGALRLCISAGAPLPLALARSFRQRFGLTIHSFYGSSECGGVCYDREGALEQEGFVGRAMNGVEIESLGDDVATQIRVRSAAVADGYFPENDAARLGGGTFIPDDLLERSADGFRIVGRVSDVINVAGKKVHPAEIELVLRGAAGVRDAVAFGRAAAGSRQEEIAACVVADGTSEQMLLDHCRRHLSGWQAPKRIFLVDALPVNERGKLNRRQLAAAFAVTRASAEGLPNQK